MQGQEHSHVPSIALSVFMLAALSTGAGTVQSGGPGAEQATDWLSPRAVHSILAGNPMPRLTWSYTPYRPLVERAALPLVVAHGQGSATNAATAGGLPRVVVARAEPAAEARPAPALILRAPSQRPDGDAGIDGHVAELASVHGVPLDLARAVVKVESSGDPAALGAAGEIGLMQIMPATARLLGFDGDLGELFEPRTNLDYGLRYLAKAYRLANGDLCGTILRYNAGHSATKMNPKSAAYCEKVRRILGLDGAVTVATRE